MLGIDYAYYRIRRLEVWVDPDNEGDVAKGIDPHAMAVHMERVAELDWPIERINRRNRSAPSQEATVRAGRLARPHCQPAYQWRYGHSRGHGYEHSAA